MAQITIPANQRAKAGEFIKILIKITGKRSMELFIESNLDTSTASYDTVFNSSEFSPYIHGFRGINSQLSDLCSLIIS